MSLWGNLYQESWSQKRNDAGLRSEQEVSIWRGQLWGHVSGFGWEGKDSDRTVVEGNIGSEGFVLCFQMTET